MKDPVIGLDENNKILFVNDEALQISGLKKEQIVGKLIQDIAVHNDLIRSLIKDVIPSVESDKEFTSGKEPIKIYADNKESYFDKETIGISIAPTGEIEKRSIGYVIMLRNITPFKELDAAKTNFIATISHELKTPLASIRMSTQLLRRMHTGRLNDEQLQLVDSIDDDASRLLKITAELLNMAQVESGNIQLNIVASKPEEIVSRAMSAAAFQAEQKNIKLITRMEDHIPEVNADPDKTAWVLVNFLTNAIRYSPDGSSITLTVNQQNDHIVFSIEDSGIGIEKQYHEKIFDRYFQVPGSQMGSGLGLAISKEFIEAQGGSIGIESGSGKGSKFYFVIGKYQAKGNQS
jgi:PAS domain S-box-containing protein